MQVHVSVNRLKISRRKCKRNLFILDICKDKWERLMAANNWNAIELRDNRYNQIIHMVSAANGAEDFYSVEVCNCLMNKSFRK